MKKNITPALSIPFFAAGFGIISLTAHAQGIANPISAESFGQLFQQIMNYFRTIAGTVAVIFIIVGGVMYMLSAGSKDMMERAKKTLIYALAGLAIVTAAPLFLSDIQLVLKGSGGGGTSALLTVAMNVLRLLLSIVGILGIIGLIIGAIWMVASAGEESRLEMGKNAIKYAIIGIILAAGALVIIQQVALLITS